MVIIYDGSKNTVTGLKYTQERLITELYEGNQANGRGVISQSI